MSVSSISDYYAGKSVLITGATGFVGKLLVEKLLYSCERLERVYCLIREKNGHSADERLTEITSCKVFDKLRTKEPCFRERLTPICGNVTEVNMGIGSAEQLAALRQSVHVVFHLAGTVNLDQDLKTSLLVNVVGLRRCMQFAQSMAHLHAFVHMSSLYANINRQFIEEKVYPATIEPQKLLNLLEWMEDEWLEVATRKLLGDKPNTFTFTKWIAETLLQQEADTLPCVIVRPSNIGAAWKEPFSGWVEKSSGPCDLFIAAGRGYLRSMKGEGHAVLDIIPVDIVVNLVISAAAHKATAKSADIDIYHCSTGGLHPFKWGEMENFVTMYSKNTPFEGAFRRPNLTLTSNSLVHDYWVFISHLIPAYMSDMGLALIGKKPRVVNVYKKIHAMLRSIEYLTDIECKCTYDNVIALRTSTCEADFKTFYFDPRGIHWSTYIENYLLGTKKYLLHEDLHGVPAAKQHLKLLRGIRWSTNILIGVMLWRLLIARSQPARTLWFFVLSYAAKFVRFFRISSTMGIKQ